MDMNKQEIQALDEKLNNPEKKVLCPRCGKVIILKEIGNSAIVRCETDGCIEGTVRGI